MDVKAGEGFEASPALAGSAFKSGFLISRYILNILHYPSLHKIIAEYCEF
jgi:hypothetical protein